MPKQCSDIAQTLETSTMPSGDTLRATSRQRNIVQRGSVVPLLLSTNSLFFQHAAVCLTSLLVNNPDLFFDIVIVSLPAEELDEQKLRCSLKSFENYSLRLMKFATPEDRLPLTAHYTIDTWTRLWVEEFFPAEINRVLYLDVDIVVVGRIAALWSTDLGGALL